MHFGTVLKFTQQFAKKFIHTPIHTHIHGPFTQFSATHFSHEIGTNLALL